jgi:hypothetical protein
MAISINPITPVIAADAASPSVTLQPGSVIDAKVLQVLANDFVRIAVASLSIEVASEVPLQVGQALQLAVSQTPQGVRLQIVPQAPADTSSPAQPATLVSPSIAPNIAPSATNAAQGVSITRPLTPLEVVAVAKALQTAAGQQGSLSPLFANLTVAATSGQVPDVLQQAAHSLLAGRPALNEAFSGGDLATAFRQSGLFHEQSQKQAAALPASSSANVAAAPDLKAALIVFRQILGSWLGGAAQPPSDEAAVPGQFAQQGQARAAADINAPSIVPASMPAAEGEEIMLPGAVVPVTSEVEVEDLGDPTFSMRDVASLRLGKVDAGVDSLQMILRAFPKGVQDAVASLLAEEGAAAAQPQAASGHVAPADTDGVPPPFRGSATSAQPAVPPTIDHHTPPDAVAHRLLDDTDAALARQTLLQIASLPDQTAHTRFDPTARWNFEVPFATPQGTAVAQFEISRDGSGENVSAEAPSRVWRARFSINLEPAGPVHAQVSLAGERTSVRMWAERSATAARLRDEAPQLSAALREAELTPGDIVIGNGTPPAQPAPHGHFLDRAL